MDINFSCFDVYFLYILSMKLYSYLQTKWISRRKCIQFIKDWAIFLNWKLVESFNQEVKQEDEIIIKDGKMEKWKDGKMKVNFDLFLQSELHKNILFNKPKWYVVSKDDKHNKTIFEILPPEFKDKYYYIWRLDKDSHGLLVLTEDPKLVNQYEHPSHEIEKEYVVQIDKKISDSDLKKCLVWVIDDWDKLKFKFVKYYRENWLHLLNIILNEWKKRHIRRVLKTLWYDVLDLMRVREGDWELEDLKHWEFRFV